jgi:hypothetical protein
MTLPTKVDERITKRFEALIEDSEKLIIQMKNENLALRQRDERNSISFWGEYHTATEAFFSLQTSFLSLIQLLSLDSQHLKTIYTVVKELENKRSEAEKMRGQILGLYSDFKSGMLENISRMVEANVAADYLGQAEHLLTEGKPGNYDHVPAAVLTGAILEDALRRLCQRQNPPIDVDKPNGEPKTLNPLIDDLKRVGLYNELKAKQLRTWAATRNHAAHGEFTEFSRQDVEQMLAGVQNFLADYL